MEETEQTKLDLCRALGIKDEQVARIRIDMVPDEKLKATIDVYVDRQQIRRIIEIVDRADKKVL